MGRCKHYDITRKFLEEFGYVLNEAEYSIAEMVANGMSHRAIGERLGRYDSEVQMRVVRIFAKLAKEALPVRYTSNSCHNCKYGDGAPVCMDCTNQNSSWEAIDRDA